jgi:hypothetical protein
MDHLDGQQVGMQMSQLSVVTRLLALHRGEMNLEFIEANMEQAVMKARMDV